MEAHDIDIIFEKTFYELSETEKSDMKDLFTNEEEFIQLKFVLGSLHINKIQQEKKTEVSPRIKESLDHMFHQTYQNKGILWYNSLGSFFISKEKQWHQQNLVRIAAVLIVLLITVPFWNTTSLKDSNVQLSKLEKQESPKTESKPEIENQKDQNATPPTEETIGYSLPAITDANAEMPGKSYAKSADDFGTKLTEMDLENKLEQTVEMDKDFSEPAVSFTGSATGFTHPDGIFMGTLNDEKPNNFALKNHSDVLDILTATY